MIQIKRDDKIEFAQLLRLYEDAGWTAYTDDIERLERAILNTPYHLSAYEDDEIVGFLRALTDFETVVYVQDILVSTRKQRQHIGTMLLSRCFEDFKHLRQKILLTDIREKNIAFYKQNGMKDVSEYYCVAFMK